MAQNTSTSTSTPATIKVASRSERLRAQHSAKLRLLERRGYKGGSSRDLDKRGLRLAAQASWWTMPEAAEYAALRIVALAEDCGLTWSVHSWSEGVFASFYRDGRKIASVNFVEEKNRWGDFYRYSYPHFTQAGAWERIFRWLIREDEIQRHIKKHILLDQDMIFEILGRDHPSLWSEEEYSYYQ